MVKVLVQSDSKGPDHQFGICHANNYDFRHFEYVWDGKFVVGFLLLFVVVVVVVVVNFLTHFALNLFQIKETRFYFNVN